MTDNAPIKSFLRSVTIVTLAAICPMSVQAEDWPLLSTPQFDTLLAAGREEGTLVLMANPVLANEFAAAFEEDTGIELQFVSSGRREGKTRFIQETEAEAASFDIYLSGPAPKSLRDNGKLLTLGDHLFLPEVTDSANWRQGELHFVDNERLYQPVPSNYVSGRILVNSTMVDPASITSWTDLMRDDLKGRIASHDPGFPGAGQTLAAYLTEGLGAEFMRELYHGQDVAVSGDYRQVTDWIARGTYAVGLASVARHVVKYQSEGLDYLQIVAPGDFPGYLVGGGAALSAPSSAPHPNAARVFANWYLSHRAQEIYSSLVHVPSDRTDVSGGSWPDFVVPAEDEIYIDTYSEDWWDHGHQANVRAFEKALAE